MIQPLGSGRAGPVVRGEPVANGPNSRPGPQGTPAGPEVRIGIAELARAIAADGPPLDGPRIEQLRNQIASGTLEIDFERLASLIFTALATERA